MVISGGTALCTGIDRYLQFYNYERLHQSLDYRTPATIYKGCA